MALKLQYVFYVVGIILIFSAVIYFAREYIRDLPDSIKLILLIIATVISFLLGEVVRGRDI